MRKNWKKYAHLLLLNDHELLWIVLLFGGSILLKNPMITFLVIVMSSIHFKKISICFLLIVFMPYSSNTIKIIEQRKDFCVVTYQKQIYEMNCKAFGINDKIKADIRIITQEGRAYQKIILKKIHKIQKGIHIKNTLLNYIKKTYDDSTQRFLKSVFFNEQDQKVYLQFHFLTILTFIKRKNRKLAIIFALFLLYFDFKLMLFYFLVKTFLEKYHINPKTIFLLNVLCTLIFLPMHIYRFAFWFYCTYQTFNLFINKRIPKTIFILFSIYFFHQVNLVQIVFFRYFSYILFINTLICIMLLAFPNLMVSYQSIFTKLFNYIPKLIYRNKIEMILFIFCVVLLIFFKKNKKYLVIFLCLLPQHFRPYQKIVVDFNHKQLHVLYYPNFGKKPVYLTKKDEYFLNKNGIQFYEINDYNVYTDLNGHIIHMHHNYVIENPKLAIISDFEIDTYITSKIDEKIMLKVKKPIYFIDYLKKSDEWKLIGKKKLYYKITRKFEIIYFCGLKFILW